MLEVAGAQQGRPEVIKVKMLTWLKSTRDLERTPSPLRRSSSNGPYKDWGLIALFKVVKGTMDNPGRGQGVLCLRA